MKNKIIILFGVFSLIVCATIISSMDWCFDSKDSCTQRTIDSKRDVKAQLQSNIDRINGEIDDLKKSFSADYVIQEAKQGRSQNVPKDLLQSAFHLIPQTYASTTRSESDSLRQGNPSLEGEISLGVTKTILAQKLAKFLKEKQAPFAQSDLLEIARQEGLNQDQAILALAITGQESSFGVAYKGRGRSFAESKELGLTYHNAAGYKNVPDCINQARYPDKDGFYLAKCPSWDVFFRGYFRKLKLGYFDRGAVTSQAISRCYVGGDCLYVKKGWSASVDAFASEIKKAIE